MNVRSSLLIASCFLASLVWAQTGPGSPPATPSGEEGLSGLTRSYRVGATPSTRFQNSNRFSALIKDGKLYLSLEDAIALAIELHADVLLMDDREGVLAARSKGLTVTGTLGVLGLAAQHGLLDLAEAFDRIKRTNFRYRQDIMDALLAEASGEA